MSELATIQTNNTVTPVDLLNIAVQKGAELDKLEKLMELQRQWEANEARKAYHQAVAEFKTESIKILKNKTVSFGQGKTSYKHATLDHILDLTVPVLAKYGLSHSWNPSTANGEITVSCVLTHSMGHSQSVSLSASPDTSGSKNSIQQVGSTVSYLERYTFLAITGLAAKDQDDDAQGAGEREGFAEGLAYGMACYKLKETIEAIKGFLADNDIHAAAEAALNLTAEEMQSIWRAPTKGGIFTTEERRTMKSDEWGEAVRLLKQ